MMDVPGHKVCDICKTPKGEINGWFMSIRPGPNDPYFGKAIVFGPIDTPIDDEGMIISHLCGDACCTKDFQQWLTDFRAMERKAI